MQRSLYTEVLLIKNVHLILEHAFHKMSKKVFLSKTHFTVFIYTVIITDYTYMGPKNQTPSPQHNQIKSPFDMYKCYSYSLQRQSQTNGLKAKVPLWLSYFIFVDISCAFCTRILVFNSDRG